MSDAVLNLIDGELVGAADGSTFDNVNPSTEEVLGVTADGSREDMQRAVAAARRAFDETAWSTDRDFRRDCLYQLKTALESEKEELRTELVAEVGCPILATYSAQLDIPVYDALTWPADQIDSFPWVRDIGVADPVGIGPSRREVHKEPVGVVGVITPWNFPLEILLTKLGPALAMGNTVAVKPPPDTPWHAARVGRLIAEQTDIPDGVVNIVNSSDHLVGEVLSTSPLVDLVAFTGSTRTGRKVQEAAAATIKRTFLELGGKSALVVLDDADVGSAVATGASTMYFHAGQGCAMNTRMLVPRSHYDEAVDAAVAAVESVPYGDPTDSSNLMGPLVNASQRDRVLDYIEKGRDEGAKLVVGGGRPAHLERGYFVEPTLFVDVDNSMAIARDEIFGPVLSVIPFDEDDDAVRIANESDYGLAGGVTSGDLDRARTFASKIRTGSMSVNGGVFYAADAPFGGYKGSGVGRQCGIEGLEMFTETKTVAWPESTA